MLTSNEDWIIQAGYAIVGRDVASRTPLERLIYCVWVADYGMRNAGDLTTAFDLYGHFHEEALQLSRELGLNLTHAAFALAPADLEQQYFQRFDAICDELRGAGG